MNPTLRSFLLLFQSTLPVGGATGEPALPIVIVLISIHAPRGGSDGRVSIYCNTLSDFNPRSPWGERPNPKSPACLLSNFNPRSPWGERPAAIGKLPHGQLFQSTLPVGGATSLFKAFQCSLVISIHAPRGGSDQRILFPIFAVSNFNPRSPWGERPPSRPCLMVGSEFQSTLPVGGATCPDQNRSKQHAISIHAPRGGSDTLAVEMLKVSPDFNPRSPWGERRTRLRASMGSEGFQSTLPVGGATSAVPAFTYTSNDFNPRSPWGERLSPSRLCNRDAEFQSTLPVGGATSTDMELGTTDVISIHAPRGGSDRCGRVLVYSIVISIHAPRGGSDDIVGRSV